MIWMLEQAFAKLRLPFVRAARYPGGAPSVFLFRVDVDGLFERNCRTLAEIAEAHGVQGSFYFNRKLCEAYPGELSGEWLRGHEIGHHADIHDLFETAEQNEENLRGGMDWVTQRLGVVTTGYVAPRGLWNPGLDQAMARLGHIYSSDFGLDFDSLPFFTDSGILQIPVHPFSPERLAVFKEDEGMGPPGGKEVLHHYLMALERQVAQNRPVHLYGHPKVLGRLAFAVLPPLFNVVARLEIPNLTLDAFARWWIARDRTELALFLLDDGVLEIESTCEAVEVRSGSVVPVSFNGTKHIVSAMRWNVLARNESDPL
jgi:peptidoglycan/xylan/chitin deacetylase (PgdA/CDA1 family)